MRHLNLNPPSAHDLRVEHLAQQHAAGDPGASVWMSANAGAGKTRVLVDRMLRLLLPPSNAAAESVLCVTYTRAAAAEMADRLYARAADWARAPEARVQADLESLFQGSVDRKTTAAARRLAARLEEARGGLNIKTLHGFCESILKRFAPEAGVPPHFAVIEEAQQRALFSRAVLEYEAEHPDGAPLRDVELAVLLAAAEGAPPSLEETAADCAQALQGLHAAAQAIDPHPGHNETEQKWLAAVRAFANNAISNDGIEALHAAIYTQAGKRPQYVPSKDGAKLYPERLEAIDALYAADHVYLNACHARDAAAFFAAAVQVRRRYEALKRRRAVLDFDDLIARTEALLTRADATPWVLYKLDGGIAHVLLDEAQDTAPAQWRIVRALTDDFFTGETRDTRARTVFAVGDEKQSIYGFRGAEAGAMSAHGDDYADLVQGCEQTWRLLRPGGSFRSAPAVLALADATARATGLPFTAHTAVAPTYAEASCLGYVEIAAPAPDYDAAIEALATKVEALLRDRVRFADEGRALHAGDILILVRSRNERMQLLASRLRAAGLPVEDPDRGLLLERPAVRTLMQILTFVTAPDDDLNTAALLRGVFGGLSEQQLFDLAHGRHSTLRSALYARRHTPDYASVCRRLRRLEHQARALLLPVEFLYEPAAQVRPLFADGATDVDALLRLAETYAGSDTPSLTSLLHHLHTHAPQMRGEPETHARKIRIRTMHGAKGTEAAAVFFFDVAPGARTRRPALVIDSTGRTHYDDGRKPVPDALDAAKEDHRARERAESARLRYVTVTRARELFFAYGVHKDDGDFAHLRAAARAAGARDEDDVLRLGAPPPTNDRSDADATHASTITVPHYLLQRARPEFKPTVLRPSALDAPLASTPMVSTIPGRGVRMHRLLQGLPVPDATDDERVTALRVLNAPHLQDIFAPGTRAEAEIAGTLPNAGRVIGRVDRLCIEPHRVRIIDFKTGPEPADLPAAYVRQLSLYAQVLRAIYPHRAIEAALLFVDSPTLRLRWVTVD